MDNVTEQSLLSGFPPVISARAHTLILGSFPSQASLAKAQYYAHPSNQFWKLLGFVLQMDLWHLSYPQRLECVLAQGLGIWDTIAHCQRVGSLDSAIRQAQFNRVLELQRRAPHLKKVCFNGQKAAKFQSFLRQTTWQQCVLPSSSAAYASMSFAQKCLIWKEYLHDRVD